jgi:hypothetical protein
MIWVPLTGPERAQARMFLRSNGVVLDGDNDAHFVAQRQGASLAACAAYTNFHAGMCEMHIAISPGVTVTRGFVWAVFDYPFIQCNYDEVIAWVPESNRRMSDILRRLGFAPHYTIERATDGVLTLFTLRAKDARDFSRIDHGLEIENAASA